MKEADRLQIRLDPEITKYLTGLVERRKYPTKSFAIEAIIREKMMKEKESNAGNPCKTPAIA